MNIRHYEGYELFESGIMRYLKEGDRVYSALRFDGYRSVDLNEYKIAIMNRNISLDTAFDLVNRMEGNMIVSDLDGNKIVATRYSEGMIHIKLFEPVNASDCVEKLYSEIKKSEEAISFLEPSQVVLM